MQTWSGHFDQSTQNNQTRDSTGSTTAVRTWAREQPTLVDMRCFFLHTGSAGSHQWNTNHIPPFLCSIRRCWTHPTESQQQRRRNTSNSPLSLSLSLPFLHPLLSLCGDETRPLHGEHRRFYKCTQPRRSLTLSLSLYIFSVLFICTGNAFLINHFHPFIY